MMDRRLWWARLSANSPRYQAWRAILESDDVPLISPASGQAKLGNENDEIHLLDVKQLSSDQLERLVEMVARKFNDSPVDIRQGIERDGTFPIRASDVWVTFDARAFL